MTVKLAFSAAPPTPEVQYLRWLFRDAGVVELRHQLDGVWATSWHSELDSLRRRARELAGRGNLFTSLHRPDFADSPTRPIRNEDVVRYTRLLFDFDPVRPKDTASTAEELAEAKTRAQGLVRTLSAHGWPLPALGMSGNGHHVQYRTALPNSDETRDIVRTVYAGLYRDHGDDVVAFDRTVRNPGRICALYGSIKRKGTPTRERPHRRSSILVPSDWRQVSQKQVEALAAYYARRHREEGPQTAHTPRSGDFIPGGTGDYRSLDVVAWTVAHGAYRFRVGDRVHAVWCPWQSEHSSPHGRTGAVILEADGKGWPNFHCHHEHCADRGIRDLMALWGDADRFCSQKWEKGVHGV